MLTCFGLIVSAQPLSNIRHKKIPVQRRAYTFDTLSVVPQSLMVKGFLQNQYKLNELDASFEWKEKPAGDSIEISYRVFPFRLNATSRHYLYDSIVDRYAMQSYYANSRNAAQTENGRLVDFGSLKYNGSFGRSLSFGNTQDAVVNSSFNLQLSGMLADSIQISAAITDNNIPIQPDGVTQQLNEFDKIWLQFKKKTWQVDLGDIDQRQSQYYFLNFYKRLQGISVQTTNEISKGITNKLTAAAAVAKGKFAQNIFNGLEGNQGPYKLTDPNHDLFFVVLANTEKVFIDGQVLQRGQDQDYVINYNTGEVTFTSKRLITKDMRIQIQFEYSDRNYLNYFIYASNEAQIGKKLKISVGAYSSFDAKTAQIDQVLDNAQTQFLSQIGDSIQKAYYPSASRDTFSSSKVLYLKRDSVVGGKHFLVYLYTASNDTALYNVSFTNLGQGNGNYTLSSAIANGNVYQWLPPVNGILQGSYEPVTLLVTPKKQQIATVKVDYALSKTTKAILEAGFSKYDINTFSERGKVNDNGNALKATVFDDRKINFLAKKLMLHTEASYETVDKKFKPLEVLRTVEFLRDWGIPLVLDSLANEKLPSVGFTLKDEKGNFFQYQYKAYLRSDGYNGQRQLITHQQNIQGFNFTNQFYYTAINSNTFKGFLLRPQIAVDKVFTHFKNYSVGASFAMDHNEQKSKLADTLSVSSYSFTDYKLYLRSDQKKGNRWSLNYTSRVNSLPLQKKWLESDISHTFIGLIELMKNPHHQFRINATYRMLDVKNQMITTQQSENSLLGRAEYITKIKNGFIVGNILYELGSGQEQKRNFSYLQVPAGQGQYTWIDYNNDGIQQLNEFEIAQFQDQANYIRVYTPTGDYLKAAYNTFNYSLTVSPRTLFTQRNLNKTQQFLSKLMWQSSLQTSRKAISQNRFEFSPFKGAVSDTNLLALSSTITNIVSFNRSSTIWGIDLNQNNNVSKSILTYGFQTNRTNNLTLRERWNLNRKFTIEVLEGSHVQELDVPNPKFTNQNYYIKTYSFAPKFTYTKNATFRIATGFQSDFKNANSNSGNQTCHIESLNIDTKYNVVQSASITAKFTFSNIGFTGATNTTASYIILDGLLPGKNYLWNINFTKRLANSLELNFQYDGRQPGSGNAVHSGQASLRALF